MQNAVQYIEEHLSSHIDYNDVARIACSSSFHFQRVFSYVMGLPLSEYIRRRRMTLAAFDLLNSDAKVIDLAMKYGYDSHSAFSRAFLAFHGISPTEARTNGSVVKACPRVSFMLAISGTNEIKYRIEKTKPYSLFGADVALSPEDSVMPSIFHKLGNYARQVLEDGTHDAINAAAGNPAGTLLTSVLFGFQYDGSCRFMFAAQLPEWEIDSSFTIIHMPCTTWAVFDYKNVIYPETADGLYKSIYSDWFPSSGYEQADGPCIEKYYEDHMEAWIPIKKDDARMPANH